METPWFRALRNGEFFVSQESAFYETKTLCGDKVVILRKQLAAGMESCFIGFFIGWPLPGA